MKTREERLADQAERERDEDIEQLKRDVIHLKKESSAVAKILRDYEMKFRQLGRRK